MNVIEDLTNVSAKDLEAKDDLTKGQATLLYRIGKGLKYLWDGRTYRKLKKDMERGGMPKQWLPRLHVPSEESALFRDLDYNPLLIQVDPKDPAVTSHELGHFTDFKKNKGNVKLYKLLDGLPIVNHLNTLLKERNANKSSWKVLQEAYKDDPELLKRFGKTRSNILNKAYMTYLTAHGIPLASAVGTSALGAYLGSRLSGNFSDKDLDTLPEEERNKILKKRHRRGKIIGGATGGLAGLIIGNQLGEKAAPAFNRKAAIEFLKEIRSNDYAKAIKELAKGVRKFKPKKK